MNQQKISGKLCKFTCQHPHGALFWPANIEHYEGIHFVGKEDWEEPMVLCTSGRQSTHEILAWRNTFFI